MNILTVDNITKSYQERKLFLETSFFLQEGEKVGVIGINGTGKSTLLKMIAGLEEPDEGKIIRANHVVIQYLAQTPTLLEEETVLQAVRRCAFQKQVEWNGESTAKSMLMELGISDFDMICGKLSGGQKKKVAIVASLLSKADILILDEPTNHLDHATNDWLEKKLKSYSGAVIMVTHDRYFLDSVTNRIVEIDKGKIYSYEANYSGFLELKMQREEIKEAEERKRQSILRVELEWVKRGARARSTKQKAHLQRVKELEEKPSLIKDKKVEMDSVSTRLGKTTIELNCLSKAYGDQVLFKDFSYIFLKNDRIGFIGPNGCGKTTLMKMIAGILAPDSGDILIGSTVKIGYFAQEAVPVDNSMRVIDYIKDGAEFIKTNEGSISATKMLERFLFTSDMQYNKIEKLSGGERRRLYLLRILMEAPNILILDEPTNDLDITTLRILEDYLDRFAGIVITVSHDRYFLDRVVRRIFAFENGKITQYEGGYTDYLQKKPDDEIIPKEKKGKEEKTGRETWKENRVKKLKFTFKEQKDYENIEQEIAMLEDKKASLEQEMSYCTTDFVKLNQINEEIRDIEQKLNEKMERWMYLEALAEKIREKQD